MCLVDVIQALWLQDVQLLAELLELCAKLAIAQAFKEVFRELRLAIIHTILRVQPLLGNLRSCQDERELLLHTGVRWRIEVLTDQFGIA